MFKKFFRAILSIFVYLYRRTGGKVGGNVQGLPVLLLTTTGRKTGKVRTLPLGYMEHDGHYVVIASNAGFDTHPAWYHNLISNPKVTLEVQDRQITAIAKRSDPVLRKQLWAELVQRSPGYGAYEKRTSREIPIVLLRPVSQS